MNRSDPSLFDPRVAAWLEEDPHEAPPMALDVVLAAVPSIKQRRARAPWRTVALPSLARFAAAVALVAVVALGGLAMFGPILGPGGFGPSATATPTPTPTATPTPPPIPTPTPVPSIGLAPIDEWTAYTSERYGFAISHPPDWTATPASRDWTAPTTDPYLATDVFVDPTGEVAVSAWAIDPGAGVSLETVDELIDWVETSCDQGLSSPCDGIAERAVPLCREHADCHAAVLVSFRGDIMAFVPGVAENGTAMLVVAIWRPEVDPMSGPYGGSRQVLLDFLSTVRPGVYLDPML